MLSYQHIFHAGNHADLLKHFVLFKVIESLNKKEKPYTFFDTHSASGLYDLYDNRSQKTLEAKNGILSLQNNNDYPKEVQAYFSFINSFVNKNLYPGSPLIELNLLRKIDELVLSELHPQEIIKLKKNIQENKKEHSPTVHIHNRNGWEMLKALTPPNTKRGAVLIDPSYEEEEDYINAKESVCFVNKKWSNGIILLWYPLLQHRQDLINNMLESIQQECKNNNPNIEIQKYELIINSKDSHKEVNLKDYLNNKEKNTPRLYGSGVLVINEPYLLQDSCKVAIEYFTKKLANTIIY